MFVKNSFPFVRYGKQRTPHWKNPMEILNKVVNVSGAYLCWVKIVLLMSCLSLVLGQIRGATGGAQLLMNSKLKQYIGLVDTAEAQSGLRKTTTEDLQVGILMEEIVAFVRNNLRMKYRNYDFNNAILNVSVMRFVSDSLSFFFFVASIGTMNNAILSLFFLFFLFFFCFCCCSKIR